MSEEFWAFSETLTKFAFCQIFELLIAVHVYRVPELGRARVKVVDGVEVEVFLVPAEERSPDTDVEVWLGHTADLVVTEAFVQKSLQF